MLFERGLALESLSKVVLEKKNRDSQGQEDESAGHVCSYLWFYHLHL